MPTNSLILVEGPDDRHLVTRVLAMRGVTADWEIKDKEGIDNLLETLRVELRASELRRVAIVVDADVPIASRWQSLRDRLILAGYLQIPERPDQDGTLCFAEGKPVVGIWLMPNNKLDGTIEDFAALLVPPGNLLWPRANVAVDAIPEVERPFPANFKSKVLIHTWLAWQAEPGVKMGAAISRKYLSSATEVADKFIQWVERVRVAP